MLNDQKITVVLLDIDGVLTDGSLPYLGDRQSGKTFHAQDGAMIKYARQQGLEIGIISGRASAEVSQRASELGLNTACIRLGVSDKVSELKGLCSAHNWDPEQVAYIGDDIPDLGICRAVGLSCAVADASPQLRKQVDHVSQAVGGRGAVAEILEALLRKQGQWDLDRAEGIRSDIAHG